MSTRFVAAFLAGMIGAGAGVAAVKDGFGDRLPARAVARLGTLRLRHPPQVRVLAFGSRKLLVTAGEGVRAWSMPSGAPAVRGDQDDRELVAVAVSADDKMGLGATADGMVALIDLKSGREIRTRRSSNGPVVALAFSRAGRAVAIGGARGAVVHETRTGDVVLQLHGPVDAVRVLAFSPDGRRLASGSADSTTAERRARGSAGRCSLPTGLPPISTSDSGRGTPRTCVSWSGQRATREGRAAVTTGCRRS